MLIYNWRYAYRFIIPSPDANGETIVYEDRSQVQTTPDKECIQEMGGELQKTRLEEKESNNVSGMTE